MGHNIKFERMIVRICKENMKSAGAELLEHFSKLQNCELHFANFIVVRGGYDHLSLY